MTTIEQAIERIRPPDQATAMEARRRQATLTKPAGSLGSLERLHVQLAAIARDPLPAFNRPTILICAADHGVADEGVSAYPRRVTAEMVRNFARGGAAINCLARAADARLVVADLGVDWQGGAAPAGVVACSVERGTRNLLREAAMSRADARRSVEAGIALVERVVADGADLIALGEMGIANTTAAAAIIAVQAARPPADVTGIGTGIDQRRWQHKVEVISQALARADCRPDDPLGTLSAVGGFEIGALAGAMLAGAAAGIPVVLDGAIVGASALLAVALCPEVRSYLIASHRSVEPGHRVVLEMLELEPLMDLGLRLGEGSGAAIALHTIRVACALPRQMATFAEAQVSEKGDATSGAARPR